MRRTALALISATLGAAPALADQASIWSVLGGHGCTLEPQSRGALADAGLTERDIDTLVASHLEKGTARQERAYVVFSEDVCQITLPVIENTARLSDADIAVQISPIDHYEADERKYAEEIGEPYTGQGEGCYFLNVPDVFDRRNGGQRGAGSLDYVRFLGDHIASGDVRFFGPEPLRTPIAMRVLTGACGETEQGTQIKANHRFIAEGFGAYVRRVGQTPCKEAPGSGRMQIAVELQGGDVQSGKEPDHPVNAWMFFEYDLITYAAGWYEGMSDTSRGTPRPPLCTYSSGD